jgi:hypothetical protein
MKERKNTSMKHALRISCLAAGILAPALFPAIGEPEPQAARGHQSGLMAKVTLPDGTTRVAKLEGVGCPLTICSRKAIKANAEAGATLCAWLDNLAAIRDTTPGDALFVWKDGTSKRMSLLNDFRVLYLGGPSHNPEKLDLAKIKSIELLAAK